MGSYRYVLTQQMLDVSDAVSRLLEVDLRRTTTMQDVDSFRQRVLYTEHVSKALAHRRDLLHQLFVQLSKSRDDSFEGEGGALLLSRDEWLQGMRALELTGADLTDRGALLAFAWSRMVVIDGSTRFGQLRESQLPFEGCAHPRRRSPGSDGTTPPCALPRCGSQPGPTHGVLCFAAVFLSSSTTGLTMAPPARHGGQWGRHT